MKLFIFLMCCFTFSLSANSFAQQEKVNLDLQGVSMKTLFSEIQRQTNLHFIFNTEQTEQLNKLTVKAKEESVKSVLDRVFEGTGLLTRSGIILSWSVSKGKVPCSKQIKRWKFVVS